MDIGSKKVDKFNNSNFLAWKQKIQLVLSLRELDDYTQDDPPVEDAEVYREWCKCDRKEMAIIGLSLSDEHSNTSEM